MCLDVALKPGREADRAFLGLGLRISGDLGAVVHLGGRHTYAQFHLREVDAALQRDQFPGVQVREGCKQTISR